MKIKKINEIKNIGNYKNFIWDKNIKEFAKYNFLYGWNYSGKTTLSRIFSFLESGSILDDFKEAQFSIETENGSITQRNLESNYPVRVYNEDFVEKNFQWQNDDPKIEPILILGKEAKELNDKLIEVTRKKEDNEESKKKIEKEKNKLEADLDKSLTDKASEIRNILGITNAKEFDKTKLEAKIEEIKNHYNNLILSKQEKNNKLEQYRSKKLENIEFRKPELKLSTFSSETKTILSKQVKAQQIIEKLKNDPKLASWVKEGINFHQNETRCQFCGNLLPDNLLENLNKHFSKEYDDLIKEINTIKDQISSHIKDIEIYAFPDSARLFDSLQSDYQSSYSEVDKCKKNYISSLQELINKLESKKEKPFESVEHQLLADDSENKLKSIIESLSDLISKHNQNIKDFEPKQRIKDTLINHFVAEFIKNVDFFKMEKNLKDQQKKIDEINAIINNLKNNIRNINQQIKAEYIGAEKINEYLKQFFTDDKLKVQPTEDLKYKIYRNNYIAKNLSTGEKNIISLCYFFAKLEEKNFDFANGVIFIDDPVSSLDSNHIFKVYDFIAQKFKNCGQLFITTHNFDFFNLLKDINTVFKNNGNFYLIKKIKNNEIENSIIDNLPQLLLKFKSEYNYLFSILKNFDESTDKSKFELLYILPNILRRFFEAYLFMKYPDGKKFKEKANKFLKDCNNIKVALKLMDEYSHEEDPTHSQKFPDIQEVEDAIQVILNEIKTKDNDHFSALNDSLS